MKLKKIEGILLRKFGIPLVVVVPLVLSEENSYSFWQGFTLFCVAFFMNWIFDVTIVEYSINLGKNKNNKKRK